MVRITQRQSLLVRDKREESKWKEESARKLESLCSRVRSLSRIRRNDIEVLMYIDEALSGLTSESHRSVWQHPLDYLISAVTDLKSQSFFVVLLSCQPEIAHLAPGPGTQLTPTKRFRDAPPHAPITETPFDCFSQPIRPSCVTLDDVGDIIFMSLFGRPLYVHIL